MNVKQNAYFVTFGISCIFLKSFAGSVNDPAGFPVAHMNTHGDFVSIGNLKIAATWQGRTAALILNLPPQTRMYGGISDLKNQTLGTNQNVGTNQISAVACTAQSFYSFDAQRSPEFPAGKWTTETHEVSKLGFACAQHPQGAVAFLNGNTLKLNQNNELPLNFAAGERRIVPISTGFLVFGPQQKMYDINIFNKNKVEIKELKSPFPELQPLTRMSGRNNTVIFADDSGTLASQAPWTSKSRIPVSPCTETQMCGVSVGTDSSWMLSGAFGTWLGRGTAFVRMAFPNLSADTGGVAIAHNSENGRFVYLGNFDADSGKLPATQLPQLNPRPQFQNNNSLATLKKWAVWEKLKILNSNLKFITWKGNLPEKWPSTWLAAEQGSSIEAPRTFQSNAAPWDWLQSVGQENAKKRALDAGIVAQEIDVAVVDSGADINHSDFKNSFRNKLTEIPFNLRDDDNNGFVDDILGFDFVDESAQPQDFFGHGSHVAGIISSSNSLGSQRGTGVNSKLIIAKALNSKGQSNSIDLARAIIYAVDDGAKVINCSWGGGATTEALRSAFAYAAQNNVLVFSSAGNDKLDTDKHPEAPKIFPGVISVGAFDSRGKLSSFSNYGAKSVFVLAPGSDIDSTKLGGGTIAKSGTSMASPVAAGAAAWLLGISLEKNAHYTMAQHQTLVVNAICQGATKPANSKQSQCGLLNIDGATKYILDSAQ